MCGIIGFNWEDKELLKKCMNKIVHRGPDDFGIYTDKNISLGHRRLSILDLSKRGRQPMSNENGDVWITFNGEIYNYVELKKKLEKKHNFKSNTDTEVIIHGYEEYGTDIVNKLEGMFAFCIYDSKKKILFLARDKAGIKPIYYYLNEKDFIFCSEIKGILEYKEIERKVNLQNLNAYLIFRANSGEETFFENIFKIMPGHSAIYDLKNHKIKKLKYWDIPENENKNSFQENLKKLKELLNDSVKKQLMSDVPYGAYLSGGIDSGVIASLMAKNAGQQIKTFSVGFEEGNSETNEAKFLAEKIDSKHFELKINRNSIKNLPNIVYHTDEPLADPTCIPIYLLSKFTKKHCTVVLTGEGADEIFAGYPQYKFMKFHDKIIKNIPKIARKTMTGAVKIIPSRFFNSFFIYAQSLGKKGLERASNFINSENNAEQYLQQISIFNQEEQEELTESKENIYNKYQKKYFGYKDVVRVCQRIDFKESMPEDLLMKLDKNSMAFSIEGRVPFLDSRIIELGFSLKNDFKIKGFTKDKIILRKAMEDIVPKETMNRKKKHFFVPIDNWLSDELLSIKEELLSKKYVEKQKIFNYQAIEKIIKGFDKSKLFYARQLWTLLTFQIWHKIYIENEKIKI